MLFLILSHLFSLNSFYNAQLRQVRNITKTLLDFITNQNTLGKKNKQVIAGESAIADCEGSK